MNAVARFDDYADLRPLPQAIDAEQAVLGALMLDSRAFAKVSDWLHAEDFAKAEHRLIFKAIDGLIERGSPVDSLTLGDWFDEAGMADAFGGPAYLVELENNTASSANIVAHAEIVVEKSRLRALIDAGRKLSAAAVAPGADPLQLASTAARELTQIQPVKSAGLVTSREAMDDFLRDFMARYDNDAPLGLQTPWADVNDCMGGFVPGELYVIGARPNMGKSVMGLQVAGHAALSGKRVALYSVEMTKQQCMSRMTACFGNIPYGWVRRPVNITEAEEYWARFTPTSTALREASLLIDATPGLSIEQLMARSRRAHQQRELDMIVVDHIHDMGLNPRAEVRHEYGRIAQGLKTLAKECNCAVVALAQLNRKNAGQRPTMTDLRESGEIEQKADVILFLHREDYYDKSKLPGVVELIVSKGRDIPTGHTIHLANNFERMRLDAWEGPLPVEEVAGPQKSRGFSARPPL